MILQGTQARTTRKSLVPVALLRLCDANMPGLGTSRSGWKDGASLHSRFPRTCRYASRQYGKRACPPQWSVAAEAPAALADPSALSDSHSFMFLAIQMATRLHDYPQLRTAYKGFVFARGCGKDNFNS